jgi:hypothetical protein
MIDTPIFMTKNGITHFYLPPRFGRGNHNDGWTPVCGAHRTDKSLVITPWNVKEIIEGASIEEIVVCPDCADFYNTIYATKSQKIFNA